MSWNDRYFAPTGSAGLAIGRIGQLALWTDNGCIAEKGQRSKPKLSASLARKLTEYVSAETLWSPRAFAGVRAGGVVTGWRIVMNVGVVGRAGFAAGLGSGAISPGCLAEGSENVY
jgi:hypothetical protein